MEFFIVFIYLTNRIQLTTDYRETPLWVKVYKQIFFCDSHCETNGINKRTPVSSSKTKFRCLIFKKGK